MWYTVQPGDTLFLIARRYGVTIQQIRQANQLTSDIINVGQRLFIPITGQQPILYTVRPGDTLFSIAGRFNTTVESIMVLNNLSNTQLTVGQRLLIPSNSQNG